MELDLLGKVPVNGGFCGIFRTIGCIGDSLSSGEFEGCRNGVVEVRDCYEYSWGQFIARACGSKVYNFSRGGLTAGGFVKNIDDPQLCLTDPAKKCQAYIVALGINDINAAQVGTLEMGSIADIHVGMPELNPDTFAGNMGKIMEIIKQVEPKARVFVMTTCVLDTDTQLRSALKRRHAEITAFIAETYEYTYLLDFLKYAPIYDAEFKRKYYLGDHLNAMGYLLTANMVMSYIDAIIRDCPEDFTQIGFVGREDGLYNENASW